MMRIAVVKYRPLNTVVKDIPERANPLSQLEGMTEGASKL